MDAIGGSFFRPDLSAFDHYEPVQALRLVDDAIRSPARASALAGRPLRSRVVAEPTKRDPRAAMRSQARKAELLAASPKVLVAPIAKRTGGKPLPQRVRAAEMPLASRDVSHVKHSTKSRVIKAQGLCKERPEPNRKAGKGSGKTFVPWCERKR